MRIRAVTFDVGGTLIRPWPSVGHVYAEIAARHGYRNVAANLLERRFRGAWRARKTFDHSRRGWESIVDEVFAGLDGPQPASRTFFPELYERFAQPEAWSVFDDVRPALAALAAEQIRVAILSNWDERLRPLLQRLGLADRFEAIIVSSEIGASKPDAKIFRAAATQLGLPAESILHVGDRPDLDRRGAIAAGFQARLIRRRPGPRPRHTLLRLTELPTIIVHPDTKTD